MQSVFSWAPKVGRKCESRNWYACGSVGRSEVVYGHVITKFSGMGRFTYPWFLRWRASRAQGLRYELQVFLKRKVIIDLAIID